MHTVCDIKIVQERLYAAINRRDIEEEYLHTPSALLLAEPAPVQAMASGGILNLRWIQLRLSHLSFLWVHAITCMPFYNLMRFSQTYGIRLSKALGSPRLFLPHHHKRPQSTDTSAFPERWTPGRRRMSGQGLTLEQRKEVTNKEYEGFKHHFPEVLCCTSESI